MSKIKRLFTNFRIMFLLAVLILAVVAINPNPWAEGVAIRSVEINSSASLKGIESPKATATPMSRERITSINGQPIINLVDYNAIVSSLEPNRTITISTVSGGILSTLLGTNKNDYLLKTKYEYEYEILGELEEKIIIKIILVNETINGTLQEVEQEIEETILVNKTIKHIIGTQDIGLKVYDAPTNNIRKGLDLQGGTRVLLQPEEKVSKDVMEITIENMKERLNVYGISDLVVREASDLSGNQYILAEIAGMNEDEVRDLLAQQGKFEAKIGNETVFYGGDKDVVYVCRSADCSGIDPTQGCGQINENLHACTFRFSIALKPAAAER
ncbi:MAG: hypothetical protein KAH32_08845, partial [Chlamydiia bacterium]|nr:hypothetical protein [Chlamydiia bacterium]